jgi:hypothetical protein|tara:strand:+ start:2040 stop:2447 length:408 start_codon:yes stop_codon:yes gene_type:complete
MAHFAKIDENNIVRRVVVVNDETADNDADGQAFLRTLYNEPDAIWKKTSYNTLENVHLLDGTPYRINFAAIGDTYDSNLDGFIKSKPNDKPSWILNTTTGTYEPPTPMPEQQENGDGWLWDESTTSWVSNSKAVI